MPNSEVNELLNKSHTTRRKLGGTLAAGLGVATIAAALFATVPTEKEAPIDHVIEGTVLSWGGGNLVEYQAGVTTTCREQSNGKAVVSAHVLLVTNSSVDAQGSRGHIIEGAFNSFDGTCEEAIAAVYDDEQSAQSVISYTEDNALSKGTLPADEYGPFPHADAYQQHINQAKASGIPVTQG